MVEQISYNPVKVNVKNVMSCFQANYIKVIGIDLAVSFKVFYKIKLFGI